MTRILLYSDEPILAKGLESVLCQVDTFELLPSCNTVAGLVEQMSQGVPDLVLMDLTMPRMDGREAFQAMHDLDPSIPVVLSSGFTEQDSVQTLSGENPTAFIQKPYQIKELRQLLQRVLGS